MDGLDNTTFLNIWHRYRHLVFAVVSAVLLAVLSWTCRRSRTKERWIPLTSRSSDRNASHVEKKEWLDDRRATATSQISEESQRLAAQKSITIPPRQPPRRVTGSRQSKKFEHQNRQSLTIQPLIFFFSLSGSTEKHVSKLVENLHKVHGGRSTVLDPHVKDLSEIDYDNFFVSPPKLGSLDNSKYFYILLIPSYNIDTILTSFLSHLQESHHDFRIDTAPLSGLAGYSVFGFGDKKGWPTEQEGFCNQAVEVDKWMARLTSRKRAFPLGLGDVSSNASHGLMEWSEGVSNVMMEIADHGDLGEGIVGSGDPIESEEEDAEADETSLNVGRRSQNKTKNLGKQSFNDLEDLGGQTQSRANRLPIAIDFTTKSTSSLSEPKEMVPVSSPTYANLTKQGYAIIGSHSGVKICRWTKSALRGRGSCYKYSFYGIKSHLCMETTPSLSCSNKCVFCWRHGTNPVGTTWRWKVDPPDLIFNGAKEAHLKKIKMMKGVPGVRAERFQEAMRIRHCALSLVGEPIFYPHINEFLELLHKEKISSFLVCNAQHPEQLQALKVVTQLYVSIDASNKESLKKVDRPLHRDFWDRFLRCLDILREKRFRMRTVFRLTLVKGFNVEDEAEGYAELVERGLPCFVEIKGVTYCGTSSASGAGLTMQNVPFYEEVLDFVKLLNSALERRGLEYGIAAEHAHSCCVLVASNRFLIDKQWHTLIDYDRFFRCLESGEEFSPEDYIGPPTPQWATFGKGGFDPADERVDRKGKKLKQSVP
ncbi:MAG: hypothetical protein Q9190_005220 [Brigantiaea leucoxantha]